MWQNYPAMHAKRKAHILAGNFGKRTALIGFGIRLIYGKKMSEN